ncbi:MAG: GNAT family N-acetyltransferase [bacterium]|nr:GNAT family N-acetyltransferase [bacterium]
MTPRDPDLEDKRDDDDDDDDRVVFRVAATPADLLKVMGVRGIVFHDEQGVSWEDEFDADDAGAVHVVGEADGQPVASGRLQVMEGGWAKLGRIAVREQWRGRGYAHGMVGALLQEAHTRGVTKLKLHAQVYLEDFYAGYGFARRGGVFDECGIDHILMTREGG